MFINNRENRIPSAFLVNLIRRCYGSYHRRDILKVTPHCLYPATKFVALVTTSRGGTYSRRRASGARPRTDVVLWCRVGCFVFSLAALVAATACGSSSTSATTTVGRDHVGRRTDRFGVGAQTGVARQQPADRERIAAGRACGPERRGHQDWHQLLHFRDCQRRRVHART